MNKMLLKRIATVVLAGIVTAETVLSGCLVIATADAESAYSAEDSMTWKLDQIEPDMNCIGHIKRISVMLRMFIHPELHPIL